VTKTKAEIRRRTVALQQLRAERRFALAGRDLPWGVPWCAGPSSPHHQTPGCEGCAGAAAYLRDRAARYDPQIRALAVEIEALTAKPVQGVLFA